MPAYDFNQLSHLDFEELTRDLLQAEFGIRLQTFKAGRDAGIDIRYAPDETNRIVVQCKHYINSGVPHLVASLKQEVAKARLLNAERYIVATSLPLSPGNVDTIFHMFGGLIKSKDDVIGNEQINNLLGCHPDIERKNFKLWLSSTNVLTTVLHNAELTQTNFEVQEIYEKLKLYVQNSTYNEAIQILDKSHVAVISGPPGVGKTTLAEMLLYAYLEKGFQPVVVTRDVTEAKRLYNASKSQIFYFDDFLGQTFLSDKLGFLVSNRDQELARFIRMVGKSKNSRFVATTREHILRDALASSDKLTAESIFSHKCVLTISDYTQLEKARILYNHFYFSEVERRYKEALLVDRFFLKVIAHENFNPRLIQWLANPDHLGNVRPDGFGEFILQVLENPHEVWRFSYEQQISSDCRDILLAVFMAGGTIPLDALREIWGRLRQLRHEKLGTQIDLDGFEGFLQRLEGGFLDYDQGEASFINPSLKDFLRMYLKEKVSTLSLMAGSANRLGQLSRIWEVAQASPTCEEGQSEISQSFLEALLIGCQRLAASPELIKDGYSRYKNDFSFPERCEFVLSVLVSVGDQVWLEEYDRMLKLWEGEAQTSYVDFDSALTHLRTLDTTDADLSSVNAFERVKAIILADIEFARSNDFKLLRESNLMISGWTEEDLLLIREAFERYILGSGFSDEMSDCSTEDEIDTMASDLKTANEGFRFKLDIPLGILEDTAMEKREEEEKRAQSEAPGLRYSGASKYDDVGRIVQMFSTVAARE